ncbi:ThuA domain-containing protein [Rhodopirellula baltica]
MNISFQLRFLILSCTMLCALLPSSSAAAQKKLDVLLVTGQSSKYHNWEVQSTAFKRMLEDAGIFNVQLLTTPASGEDMSGFDPVWSDYDAVLLDYEGDDWPDAAKKSFEKYMEQGGGLVVVHATNNAFPNWQAFLDMTGLGGWGGRTEEWGPKVRWRDGKTVFDTSSGTAQHPSRHDFPVVSRAPEHPIMKGLPSMWLHANDELYSQLRGPANDLTVLATASAVTSMRNGTGENEPILMTIQYGKGRVFHTTLGHVAPNQSEPVDSLQCVGFITTLQRGTEWAATGTVTQEIPDDFPTADQTSLRQ